VNEVMKESGLSAKVNPDLEDIYMDWNGEHSRGRAFRPLTVCCAKATDLLEKPGICSDTAYRSLHCRGKQPSYTCLP
jgi:hypothetical protein